MNCSPTDHAAWSTLSFEPNYPLWLDSPRLEMCLRRTHGTDEVEMGDLAVVESVAVREWKRPSIRALIGALLSMPDF